MIATKTRDYLAAIKRRQRDPHPDPTTQRLDIDWLLGEIERRGKLITAMWNCLTELWQLTRDVNATLAAVGETARKMANDPSLNGFSPRARTSPPEVTRR